MRTIALAVIAAALVLAGAVPAPASSDDHANALAALADERAAVAEIVRIEDGNAVGHGAYLRAAHRALNALVGRRDDGYAAAFGDPGDGIGTLGHLDRMLDQTGSDLWTPAVQGAKANVLAAAENIHSAFTEKQMEDYQADLTHALANLALVVGRPSERGVFGGLSGALANTSLGVPRGAVTASGCALPARAPAYGVVSGRLVYVALPRGAASSAIPDGLGITRVVVRGDDVVLYTYAAREAGLCGRAQTAAVRRSRRQLTRDVVAASATVPYTQKQAKAGVAVYRTSCVQCHGADLQGTAGPAVAGTEFQANAKRNKWTLNDLRTTVFENMPFSNPASLTPKQYADVMAFLLASNCYPAGTKPFPSTASPPLAKIKLGPVHGVKPANPKLGTCAVK